MTRTAVATSGRRVLICGSRRYRNRLAIVKFVRSLPRSTVVIHGAAPGADSIADSAAEQLGLERLPFPADWNKFRGGAGPIRNKQMLDEGEPTEVAAFVSDPTNSPGTANMVLQSMMRGLPVVVYGLDGRRRN